LVVPAALALSACGSSPSTSPSTTSSTSPTAKTTTSVPATTTTAAPTTTTSAATTTTGATAAVLAPATTPPVVSECSLQLSFAADGNVSPLFCTDGGINVLAWNYFAGVYPQILSLGANATPTQVQSTMCAQLATGTVPTVQSAGQIAERYYGWRFAVDPITDFNASDC
jgi:hypothetical protein